MYSIFHPKLKSRSRNTRTRNSYRGSLLSAFPLDLMQWKLSLKDAKITSDYGLWGGGGKWITHIFHVPVVFLLQCDSESDIDDKVRLPFLCLFTRHLEAFESRMNNKWDHDGGRRSQSRKMARLKKNGELEELFVFFFFSFQKSKELSGSGKKKSRKGGFCRKNEESQMSLPIFMNAHFIPRCSTDTGSERRDSCL